VNSIAIGTQTSIGDRAVVHVAKIQGDFPTVIGDGVTVGAGALIHAATLHNYVLVGEAAQILDGAIVESESIVAPGSIVTAGTVVKTGELWSGTPARKVRVLTEGERAGIITTAAETVALALRHAMENEKDYKTVLEEEEVDEIRTTGYRRRTRTRSTRSDLPFHLVPSRRNARCRGRQAAGTSQAIIITIIQHYVINIV
jgi:gamma-carbonic anhydrase